MNNLFGKIHIKKANFKNLKKIKGFIGILIVIVIFYFLFSSLYVNWKEIKKFNWHFNYLYLSGSFILLMARHLLMPYIWQKILNNLYVKINFLQSFNIWYLALGGRYLPGRIWYALGMLYFSAEIGIAKKKVLIGGVFNIILSLSSAFVAALAVLPYYIPWEINLNIKIICAIIILPLFYLLFFIIKKTIQFIIKKRNYEDDFSEIRFANWIYPFTLYLITWILYGLSLYLLILSVATIDSKWIIQIVSFYSISHVAGFLAFITPAGLAVREGVLTILLSRFFPSYVASSVAILCRLVFTLAELTCFLVALVIKKFSKKSSVKTLNLPVNCRSDSVKIK